MLKLHQYADVSTAHVSRDDDRALHQDALEMDERRETRRQGDTPDLLTPRLIVLEYDAGYFVHTTVAEDEEEMGQLKGRYSPELLALLGMAFEAGAIFLRLDRDGELYDDLPKHQWGRSVMWEERAMAQISGPQMAGALADWLENRDPIGAGAVADAMEEAGRADAAGLLRAEANPTKPGRGPRTYDERDAILRGMSKADLICLLEEIHDLFDDDFDGPDALETNADKEWDLQQQMQHVGGAFETYGLVPAPPEENDEEPQEEESEAVCASCGHTHGEHDDFGRCEVTACSCTGWDEADGTVQCSRCGQWIDEAALAGGCEVCGSDLCMDCLGERMCEDCEP